MKNSSLNEIEKNVKPYENSFTAMVPTSFVIYWRTNFIWQAIRFLFINIKMIAVVRKSH